MSNKKQDDMLKDDDWCVLYSYSRAQALDDGVLVDVSRLAQEAGIRFPVAMSSAAWHDCVAVPTPDIGQDETGRLWDVLNVFRFAARGVSNSDVRFSVVVVRGENSQQEVKLKALCHPGNTAEPVITIMLPDEN